MAQLPTPAELRQAVIDGTIDRLPRVDWTPVHATTGAWLAADVAWSAELRRAFGARAGDVRYTPAGVSTPELLRLHAAWVNAERDYRLAGGQAVTR